MTTLDLVKGWLIENAGVPETASEDDFRAAMNGAISDGSLTFDMIDAMREETDGGGDIATAVADAVEPLATKVAELEQRQTDADDFEQKTIDRIDAATKASMQKLTDAMRQPSTESQPTKSAMGALPRVKTVKEMYSHTKSAMFYPSCDRWMGGQPVKYMEQQLETTSKFELAIIGATFKWLAHLGRGRHPVPPQLTMTDHDRELVKYAVNEMPWTGIVYGEKDSRTEGVHDFPLPDRRKKEWTEMLTKGTILTDQDGGTSGGTQAVPNVFDTAVITTPLLYGELAPLVNIVPLARGRVVDAFSISNVSFTSGTAEGTAITAFTTDSMIAAFDTTIYNAVGAIYIGNDFEQDSPVAIGALVVQLYGEAAKAWLDNQLANGDGTTEIQGVFNASGITDIGNPAGGANAAPQPDDFITLIFNVAKQYRPPAMRSRTVFIANDTSYRRARAIAVGAADERRVFGNDVSSYQIFEYPFKVQNDIANTVAGFFAMQYYRLYRRLGVTITIDDSGDTLRRGNKTLITCRMRWGGKLELGGAGAYSDNWQT